MHLLGVWIAGLSGLVAIGAGAEPTGRAVVDAVLVFGFVAGTSWFAGRAPWWATAGAAYVGVLIAFDPIVFAVAVVVCLFGLARRFRRSTDEWSSTLVAGAALNVLLRSDLGGFTGSSALVTGLVGAVLIATALHDEHGRRRRLALVGLAALALVTIVGTLGALIAGLSARSDLQSGVQLSRDASRAIDASEYVRAGDLLAESADRLAAANGRLDGPLTVVARAVPVVAQNVDAGVELTAAAAATAQRSSEAVLAVDLGALTLTDGAFDLDAVRSLRGPVDDVHEALGSLRDSIDDAESPWLIPPIQGRLHDLADDYDANEEQLETAIEALRLAPTMLGGAGERRYLALFTTPSEARGLGGFVGNYTQLILDDGRLSFTDFARRSELEDMVARHGASCATCPTEFVDMYGSFGFDTGPQGGVAERAWSNITMSPHYPSVAATAASLFAEVEDVDVDGVIVLDPYVLQALMRYTGEVRLAGGELVSAENAAAFILRDQYSIADDATNVDRIDALEQLGDAVISALLDGAFPGPVELGRDLAPLVDERRLLMWSSDPVEQQLLAQTGLVGALPSLDGGLGFGVTFNNAAGNKIDVFLEREVETSVRVGATGEAELVADVRLVNGAPRQGLSQYVIGNVVGLPDGYSRTLVTFYGPGPVRDVTSEGVTIEASAGEEAGWSTSRHFVELGPGEAITYRVVYDLSGSTTDAEATYVSWEQPLSQRSPND